MSGFWRWLVGMFSGALGSVGEALLLQIFNIDVEQTSQPYTVVENFARCECMCVDLEHLLVTCNDRGDATHINDVLTNALHIEVLAAQQEDNLVAKLLFNSDTSFFDVRFRRLWRERRRSFRCCGQCNHLSSRLTTNIVPYAFQDGAEALTTSINHTGLLEER